MFISLSTFSTSICLFYKNPKRNVTDFDVSFKPEAIQENNKRIKKNELDTKYIFLYRILFAYNTGLYTNFKTATFHGQQRYIKTELTSAYPNPCDWLLYNNLSAFSSLFLRHFCILKSILCESNNFGQIFQFLHQKQHSL